MKTDWEFLTRTIYDPAVFWAMLTAVATLTLIVVAYWQLRNLAKTSRSDFLYRLRTDFFNEESRKLIFLVENDLLEFRGEEIPYFAIVGRENPLISYRLDDFGVRGDSISTYLMDDMLLGPMEDIGVLEKRGMVTLEEVYETFVTYIRICMANSAVQAYLHHYDDPDDDDVYDNVQDLHRKLTTEAPIIRARKAQRKKFQAWKSRFFRFPS